MRGRRQLAAQKGLRSCIIDQGFSAICHFTKWLMGTDGHNEDLSCSCTTGWRLLRPRPVGPSAIWGQTEFWDAASLVVQLPGPVKMDWVELHQRLAGDTQERVTGLTHLEVGRAGLASRLLISMSTGPSSTRCCPGLLSVLRSRRSAGRRAHRCVCSASEGQQFQG